MSAAQWFLVASMVLAALALTLGIVQIVRLRRQVRQDAARLAQANQRLEMMVWLNRELVAANDEKSLVEVALAAIDRLVDGLGASFVPFDAWGQALPAFTFGDLPEPVLRGWAEHLVSDQTRARCSTCQELRALAGQPCPLKTGPLGGAMSIYCLPLTLGVRDLGMVNVYLPPERSLDEETRAFLQGVTNEMALAVDAIRLRNQELATLRQLQRLRSLRSPRSDLVSTLQSLLDGVRNALGVDGLALQVRHLADERLSDLRVLAGEAECLPAAVLEDVLRQAQVTPTDDTQDAGAFQWIVAPLALPEGQSLGALLALNHADLEVNPRQWRLLHTAAAQAALMVENERLNLSLEYSVVIQERNRLAREIHDGLAQTLAFLKMQIAQMQTAFHQGDSVRLNRLLADSRQALAEAYQETRQSIDNLRLEPDEKLTAWLEQLAQAFEHSTGIPVVRQFQDGGWEFLPEISAQLVRIVQEALNNVRKHAHASQVTLSVRRWQRDLVVEICDNGQGFAPEDVPMVAQYGLRGMRERAELIGADFQIISQPRRGATVRLSLPLAIEEESE